MPQDYRAAYEAFRRRPPQMPRERAACVGAIETLRRWLGDELFFQVEDTVMEYGELREKIGFAGGFQQASSRRPQMGEKQD